MPLTESMGSRVGTGFSAAVILLMMTFLSSQLAILCLDFPKIIREELTRLLTIAITLLAMGFTFTVGRMAFDLETKKTEYLCSATYITCTIWWLAVKSLIYCYFNEKLHIYRGSLKKKNMPARYYVVILGVYLSSIPVVFFLIHYIQVEVKQGQCSIELVSNYGVVYALISSFFLSAYFSTAFFRLPPPTFEEMLLPHSPAQYTWLSAAVNITPIIYYVILLLISDNKRLFMLLAMAPIDMGVTVGFLTLLEGKKQLEMVRTESERSRDRGILCRECRILGNNGEGAVEFCTVPMEYLNNGQGSGTR